MIFHPLTSCGGTPPDAYQRLLLGALKGDAFLVARGDSIDSCWRRIDPVIDGWSAAGSRRGWPIRGVGGGRTRRRNYSRVPGAPGAGCAGNTRRVFIACILSFLWPIFITKNT